MSSYCMLVISLCCVSILQKTDIFQAKNLLLLWTHEKVIYWKGHLSPYSWACVQNRTVFSYCPTAYIFIKEDWRVVLRAPQIHLKTQITWIGQGGAGGHQPRATGFESQWVRPDGLYIYQALQMLLSLCKSGNMVNDSPFSKTSGEAKVGWEVSDVLDWKDNFERGGEKRLGIFPFLNFLCQFCNKVTT